MLNIGVIWSQRNKIIQVGRDLKSVLFHGQGHHPLNQVDPSPGLPGMGAFTTFKHQRLIVNKHSQHRNNVHRHLLYLHGGKITVFTVFICICTPSKRTAKEGKVTNVQVTKASPASLPFLLKQLPVKLIQNKFFHLSQFFIQQHHCQNHCFLHIPKLSMSLL